MSMKLKRATKSHLNFYNIKKRLEIEQIKNFDLKKTTGGKKKNKLFNKRKGSLKYIKPKSILNFKQKSSIRKTINHDEIFKNFLNSKITKKKKPIKLIKKIKEPRITISKKIFTKLIKNFKNKTKTKKTEKTKKSSKSLKPKKTVNKNKKKTTLIMQKINTRQTHKNPPNLPTKLSSLKKRAIKNLINENFNLKSSSKITENSTPKQIDKNLIILFQKELILENLLKVLDNSKIDITDILYTAFENIQSEYYFPKSNESLVKDGYFVLEDVVKHPPRKRVLGEVVMGKLNIDLEGVDKGFEED